MVRLYIGNKNYSSWSLRPWIGLRVAGLDFEEVLVPFDMAAGNPKFADFSPTNKVPVLEDGDVTVWESLAILDHMARKHPEAGLWPADAIQRSAAMAMSCEMLSSFAHLRNDCPMNMRREPAKVAVSAGLAKDVTRIEALWSDCLTRSGGPFLFGDFTLADAMFAPVVNRLDVYAFDVSATTRAYMDAMKAMPAWQEWEAAGRAEPWVVEEDEA
jgi:glutathione S-transferase